jgi:hypothetical protein
MAEFILIPEAELRRTIEYLEGRAALNRTPVPEDKRAAQRLLQLLAINGMTQETDNFLKKRNIR